MNQQKNLLDEWYHDILTEYRNTVKNQHNFLQILLNFEQAVKKMAGVEEACVIVPDRTKKQLIYPTCDTVAPLTDDGGSVVLESYYTRKVCNVEHARRHFLYRQKIDNPHDKNIQSILTLPMIDVEEVIAILWLATTQKERAFSAEEIVRAETFFDEIKPPIVSSLQSDEAEAPTPPPAPPPSRPAEEAESITVLAIDDSAIILKLIKNLFNGYRVNVLVASCGVEGIDLFTENKIDLIFMDEIMEEISGHETIAKIRTIEKSTQSKPIPILGLTSDDSAETKARLIQSGATEVLYKPILPERVYAVIQQHVKLSAVT
jgi:CheY-like chemotaxis protein